MAGTVVETILAERGSHGLMLRRGNTEDYCHFRYPGLENLPIPCRVFCFSPCGSYFAYCDEKVTNVTDAQSPEKIIFQAPLPRTSQLYFSPRSTYLCTWEPYAVRNKETQGEPNLKIFRVATGEKVAEYISRKQKGWHPEFSDDEQLATRLVGSELLCHENGNFDKYARKMVLAKIDDYKLSFGPAPFHIAAYVPPQKGQPASVRVLRYPEVEAAIANKTFWKADRVSLIWNKKGSALIVMAILDVDSTGQSYYGEQNVYMVLTNGESYMISLDKKGPVYHIEFSPNSAEFCVVYGFMPAKATLFNLKGDALMEFGAGPRNECHYNAFGNVVCICGFGNLRGNMEFWSMRDRKLIAQIKAEDTTLFQWAPDGEHFITATTTPRLRVNNGYRIWHYTGALVGEKKVEKELWEVGWRPGGPPDPAKEFKIRFPAPASASASASAAPAHALPNATMGGPPVPAGALTANSTYVPPHLRNRPSGAPPLQGSEPPAGKAKKAKGTVGGAKTYVPPTPAAGAAPASAEEREKKIRNLKKKLDQIATLKEKQASGAPLEKNQVEKIEKEAELAEELEKLTMEEAEG